MVCAVFCEEDIFRQMAGIGGFGQDAQALGQKQTLLAPMALLAERPDPLDQRVGKGGYLTGQGTMLR